VFCAGRNGSTLAPSIGTAAAVTFSAVLYAFLPETQGRKLPLTIKEAEKLPG